MCYGQDPSGDVLDQILDETSFIVHNDGSPTSKFQHQASSRAKSVQKTEILDLVLSSDSFANKIIKFEVLNDYRMESDHSPILFHINCSGKIKKNTFPGEALPNFQ